MDIKRFLNKILNTFTKTHKKKEKVFSKNGNLSLLKKKPVDFDINPSTLASDSSNIHPELLKQIFLSQLDRAILAASQIRYYSKNDSDKTDAESDGKQDLAKQKVNVKVNAGLLPLPEGLIAILDICNSSFYTFPKNNKL